MLAEIKVAFPKQVDLSDPEIKALFDTLTRICAENSTAKEKLYIFDEHGLTNCVEMRGESLCVYVKSVVVDELHH